MTGREYLVVMVETSTNWSKIAQSSDALKLQTWENTFYIWRPGAKEPEKLDGGVWAPGATKPEKRVGDGDPVWATTIFNELGAEGWRLVSEAITSSTVVTSKMGWFEVSSPVVERWIFEREVVK